MGLLGDVIGGAADFIGIGGGDDAAAAQEKAQRAAAAANQQLAQDAQKFFSQQAEKGVGAISQYGGQGAQALGGAQAGAYRSLTDMYGQARADMGGSTDRLGGMLNQGLYSGFEQDPGYQFRLQQGEQALGRSAAARGGRLGGAQLKALADYGQGMASQEFGNFAARRQGEAGILGSSDAQRLAQSQSLANLASQYGAQSSGMQMQTGAGLANLYGGMGGNIANLYGNVGQAGMQTAQSQMQANSQAAQAAGMAQQATQNQNMQLLGIGALALSDIRLKSDIRSITNSPYEKIGLRGVTWWWNNDAEKFGLSGQASGVVAQEVMNVYPHAVFVQGGYLAVDYDKLHAMIDEAA